MADKSGHHFVGIHCNPYDSRSVARVRFVTSRGYFEYLGEPSPDWFEVQYAYAEKEDSWSTVELNLSHAGWLLVQLFRVLIFVDPEDLPEHLDANS